MGYGLCLAIGVLFLGIGLMWWVRSTRLSRQGVRVVATVVAFEAAGEDGQNPVVEFDDLAGRRHRVAVSWTPTPHPGVGRPLPIIYDPVDPGRATGASFEHLWLFPIAFAGMGGITVLIGLRLLVRDAVGQ